MPKVHLHSQFSCLKNIIFPYLRRIGVWRLGVSRDGHGGQDKGGGHLGRLSSDTFFPEIYWAGNSLTPRKKYFCTLRTFFSLCLSVWMSVKFFSREKKKSLLLREDGGWREKQLQFFPQKCLFSSFFLLKKGKNIASSGNRKDSLKFVFFVKRVLSFERRDDD